MKYEDLHDVSLQERISVRVPGAVRLTGLSRSKIYQLMKSGEIEFIKVGGSTLIPTESLKQFIGRQVRVTG